MASGNAQKKRSFSERFKDGAKMIIFGDSPIKDSPKALFTTPGTYEPVYPSNFNGEKNLGELGPMRYYFMDYVGLRFRSWQAFIESATGLTVIKKFGSWVVGKGLKLQAEPSQALLQKINPDLKNSLRMWRRDGMCGQNQNSVIGAIVTTYTANPINCISIH